MSMLGMVVCNAVVPVALAWVCARVAVSARVISYRARSQRSDLYFASGSADGVVRLWDVRRAHPVAVFRLPDAGVAVTALAFKAHGRELMVGSSTGTLYFLFCAGEVRRRPSPPPYDAQN
jgi:WD40 repeat protein